MSERRNISEYCVYTILHKQKLKDFFEIDGAGEAKENTVWREGRRLFLETQKHGEQMPVFFGAADTGAGLIYYAFLKDVDVDDEEPSTKYKFTQLTKLENNPSLSSLKLKSTKQPLSNDYIRPYAVCYTPSFARQRDV